MKFREVTTVEVAYQWIDWLRYDEGQIRAEIPFALRARIHNHMLKVILK